MRMRLLTVLVLAIAAHRPAGAEELRLTVLHTTDLHGALTGWDDLNDRPSAGGLARIATLVARARAEGHPLLVLDGGDALQGSAVQTAYRAGAQSRPEPVMAAMRAIGYDAMAVGNHEFDHGPQALERARREGGFPWLSANAVQGSDGKPAFDASIVRRFGSLRVGVVGLTTPTAGEPLGSLRWNGMRFGSPVDAARHEVERLRRDERCDAIVLIAHTGLEQDPATGRARPEDLPEENWGERLAAEVPGVDLLILGHTHAVIDGIELGGALVTQSGQRGEALGRAELTFTRADSTQRWARTRRFARVTAVADSVREDEALLRLATPYRAAADSMLSREVGRTTAAIDAPRGRFADGPLWNLIHAAQLAASGADVSLAPLYDPSLAIPAGPIRLRDVMRMAPYENRLIVLELTGAQLKETLEESARYFAGYTFAHGRELQAPERAGYNYETAEGVTYEIDLTRPEGDRIVNLYLGPEPLATDRVLRVAMTSYRAIGGGGYTLLRDAKRLSMTEGMIRDVIVDYLRGHDPLTPRATVNWTLLPDYAASRERPLVDLLVRQEVVPRDEVMRLHPDEPGRRGDLAYWLSRAFGWRAKRLSGAFADVPDSLEPWLDGLMQRGVLGDAASTERFRPFANAPLSVALDWCERAARYERYAVAPYLGDRAFRLGLLTGVYPPEALGTGTSLYRDTLTRAQILGMVANTRFPTVRILETTDFHGAILSGARDRRGRAWGGSVALASHVRRLRAENPFGTVLVDGGDWYQGTMISNLAFGRPVVEQMNELGYTAAAIGNHEFDWTADTLIARIGELQSIALGANIRDRKNNRRPAWAKSDTTVVRRGVRVGVLGLSYRFTPSVTLPRHVAHLRFEDDSTVAAKLVPDLRKRSRPNVVVAVGHVPTTQDSAGALRGDLARMARGIPGVDVWLGGHSHNRVNGEIGGIPVMIAGSHGQVVAVCDLVVDPVRDRVIERYARLEPTYADAATPDSALTAMVGRWNKEVAVLAAEPVGHNAARLTRTRGGESTVGNLVTDAMRAEVGADIAMQNTGGLRADLPEGPVTKGHIFEIMPFENTIVTMELTGTQVRRAIEEGLRGERVTQISGLKYEFAFDRPDFQRLVKVTLPDGSPFEEDRSYKVAVNNFMAEGGDDYAALKQGKNPVETVINVRDALEAFVRSRCEGGKSLEYRLEGRIVRTPGSQAPSRPD
jgi:2',3'-cyclic-nucleotide 2'-phosphodiesterase/3'-nucleotidase